MKQFITILSAIILMAIASFTTQAQNSQQFDDGIYTSTESTESAYFPRPTVIQVGDFVYQLNGSYSYWCRYDLVSYSEIPSEVRFDSKILSAIKKKLEQTYSDYNIDIQVGLDQITIDDYKQKSDQDNKRKQTVDNALAKIIGEDCVVSDNVESETTSGTNVGYYSGTSTGSYGSKPVHVKSYTRVQNGKVVHVSSHYRSAPRRR